MNTRSDTAPGAGRALAVSAGAFLAIAMWLCPAANAGPAAFAPEGSGGLLEI